MWKNARIVIKERREKEEREGKRKGIIPSL